MQYWRLSPCGLKFVSRISSPSILIFLGSPAWIASWSRTYGVITGRAPSASWRPMPALAVLILRADHVVCAEDRHRYRRADAPKRATGTAAAPFLSRRGRRHLFLMLSPIMWLPTRLFSQPSVFGGSVGWGGVARDDNAVPFDPSPAVAAEALDGLLAALAVARCRDPLRAADWPAGSHSRYSCAS